MYVLAQKTPPSDPGREGGGRGRGSHRLSALKIDVLWRRGGHWLWGIENRGAAEEGDTAGGNPRLIPVDRWEGRQKAERGGRFVYLSDRGRLLSPKRGGSTRKKTNSPKLPPPEQKLNEGNGTGEINLTDSGDPPCKHEKIDGKEGAPGINRAGAVSITVKTLLEMKK